ncbi:DEAD/DEAH box helicase [Methyloversatilis thermotolerans]|uniref:DEAD/DEAH box helicase n=1 Tax=Methyloversatilis thermotolerans TaxID=1346290 RepID=UPI000364BC05|nr:DEAD/DEAH box helicase [Methyloversatilis thermotolerans]
MELTRLLSQLDARMLGELFSEETIKRGRQYITQVGEIEVNGSRMRARVRGSESTPYEVIVRLERREYFGELTLEVATRCTCPVGNRCKHAVALLLAAQKRGELIERPRGEVLKWAQTLRQRLQPAQSADKKRTSAPKDAIAYVLVMRGPHAPEFKLLKARLGRDGEFSGAAQPWFNYEQALLKPPSFVQDSDLPVFRTLREAIRRRSGSAFVPFEISGSDGLAVLRNALETGRTFIREDDSDFAPAHVLHTGDARAGHLEWQTERLGVRAMLACTPPAGYTLPTDPPWYLDLEHHTVGEITHPQREVLQAVLELPVLSAVELPLVAEALGEVAPGMPSPLGLEAARLPQVDTPLTPVLKLDSLTVWHVKPHRRYDKALGNALYDIALPAMRYGEVYFAAGDDSDLASLPSGRAVRVKRDRAAEETAMKQLTEVGFAPVKSGWLQMWEPLPVGALGLESEEAWGRFFADAARRLTAAGWQIDCPPMFRHRVLVVDEWHADIEEGENGWLELSLGIDVGGRRMDLAPLLHALFRRDRRWLDPVSLDRMDDDDSTELYTAEGERIVVQTGRIKPLARTLVDLFDNPGEGPLAVSRMDAPRLAEALGADWTREGFQSLEQWVARLRSMDKVQAVDAPAGFGIELRPYQREGLAWLQHLRAHDIGGILADDMGLGKTAQTLAHLLTEKQSGRLDRPALVVLPTSLVFNWQREAERFAPALRVLKLHGPDRFQQFARVPQHDVCLTTYPLLWRDHEKLAEHDYHLLILDEAQTVKNAGSQAARAVRTLRARHRLCLTGTPLENHLGELWAQFDFLLPGFLGEQKDFTRHWRTPIEKHGDLIRRELLARRVAPFILRRRKDDVAADLPPKTEVVRTVELAGRQRDLYETVRVAMDKRVREEIASRGFARSRIVILDALLKLRQVCCDPRLLKTDAAARVKERAKLDLLMDMLDSLLAEGRKVLVFSQFTGMLDLIHAALTDEGIDSVMLTGDTQNREAVVRRFQEGTVPVFLISLKAGGVGLNLTAADTVIHYDPWWNPAAENQASDRAHRIGQDKPVFVYKLIVAGSIEERIVALQEKKAALAEGILGNDEAALEKFGESDLAALLEPLAE